MKRMLGFTMLELIIAIVILGIISTFGIRSYRSHLIKARRTEAHTLMQQMMSRVEQFYLQNNHTYPATLNAAYAPGTPPTSTFYTFSSASCGTDCFRITATATTGGSQANDTGCTILSLDSTGTRNPTTGGCWNR